MYHRSTPEMQQVFAIEIVQSCDHVDHRRIKNYRTRLRNSGVLSMSAEATTLCDREIHPVVKAPTSSSQVISGGSRRRNPGIGNTKGLITRTCFEQFFVHFVHFLLSCHSNDSEQLFPSELKKLLEIKVT
ncbi:hypothetical protein TNCV_4254661 [Trichonephila clavipes]|nr:hypothetical protein TNCV_4254661 [Trichonephila clavipes]